MLPIEEFRFGIEHEFAALDGGGFCDFTTCTFEDLDRVIAELPVIESDYPRLRVGDLGIKSKRWYIEGFERFSEAGDYLLTDPKGYEIRTPICSSIDEAVDTLARDIGRWEAVADRYGYRAARVSFNPFRAEYVPDPPLNGFEIAQRVSPEEQTAHIHMLTYGPDISFSHPALSAADTIDIGKKLTHYSPFIVPFSFSSPFFRGRLWGGHSRRTHYRTGARPAVLVFVEHDREITPSFPTLTDKARLPAEVGRIEFKAFDCPPDVDLYRSLGTLLLGIALDDTLTGRASVPDGLLHKRAALDAFGDIAIREGAEEVLRAAKAALPAERREPLGRLEEMLAKRQTPALAMIDTYHETGDVIAAIELAEARV